MLGDIEAVLYASKSKSAFPKFKDPLSPAQVKVVEDYLARIRAQMVRVVEGQGIPVRPQRMSGRPIFCFTRVHQRLSAAKRL
jgi:hypothetical protein